MCATSRCPESANALRKRFTRRSAIDSLSDAKYFLLELDLKNTKVNVRGYEVEQFEKATNDYLAVEKEEKTGTISDAVLVSVDSMANLRRAYPNYFLDTRVFGDAVEKAIK